MKSALGEPGLTRIYPGDLECIKYNHMEGLKIITHTLTAEALLHRLDRDAGAYKKFENTLMK